MLMESLRPYLLVLIATFSLAVGNSATAQINYSSNSFDNLVIVSSDAAQYSITADILEGGVNGVVAGTISGSLTFGGGTNPFNTPNWNDGQTLTINGISTADSEANETADGHWSFTVTPTAGYQVDGISLFTNGTSIANPTFANLTSNGIATVVDANEGLSNELFNSQNSGAFVNGSDLVFNTGTTSAGITSANHTQLWSYDSAGATQLNFDYLAGPTSNISNEGLRLDVQLSAIAVPEPSTFALMGLFGSLAVLRRRRK